MAILFVLGWKIAGERWFFRGESGQSSEKKRVLRPLKWYNYRENLARLSLVKTRSHGDPFRFVSFLCQFIPIIEEN